MWHTGGWSNHFGMEQPARFYFFFLGKCAHEVQLSAFTQMSHSYSWLEINEHKSAVWAQRMRSAPTADMWVCFFVCECVFFSLPTQRGRLKWTDYSSHERQHNSRVAFEPYGDKKKKKRKESEYSPVQRWFSHGGENLPVAAAICRFTAGDLTQPVAQTLCDTQESLSAQLWPQRTLPFSLIFFFTTIKLYRSCLSE